MKAPLVAGNWKMNGSRESIRELMAGLESVQGVERLVLPPYVYLDQVSRDAASGDLRVGAQNVDWRSQGAITGEIEASMLVEMGCRYCLVGHSERRQLFLEDNDQVARKFGKCLEHGLIPVLCVGETLDERRKGQTMAVVEAQLRAVLDSTGPGAMMDTVVAYEPVWAIGTGESATPEEAREVHGYIRGILREHDAGVAEGVRIVYGGSVNPDNAGSLFRQKDVDGALVGGASLKSRDFNEICRAAAGMLEN